MSDATFHYTASELKTIAKEVLARAHKMGASNASVELSEGQALSVGVRQGTLETVEHNQDKSLEISVYVGSSNQLQRGHASTNDFSTTAIERTLAAAYRIAQSTAADTFAGLADPHLLFQGTASTELSLFHPWSIDVKQATAIGIELEKAAFEYDPAIFNSEGAQVYAYQGQFVLANSHGFCQWDHSSSHSLSVNPIARHGQQMQRDGWYSQARNPIRLAKPNEIGRYAAARAVARLTQGQIANQTCPVLFEAPLAIGLIGSLVQALNGSAQYRQETFLLNSENQLIFQPHIQLEENPFIPEANGSGFFDAEGVSTKARSVIQQGVVQGYFLNSYSARQLKRQTTGNAGGSHNLHLTSSQTRSEDDFATMLKKLGRGLLVTELMGQGTNYVTGDYSRGASGFWVENGMIQYAVDGVTLAGNLRDMYQQLTAIGNDTITRGNKTTGSILIESMRIGAG